MPLAEKLEGSDSGPIIEVSPSQEEVRAILDELLNMKADMSLEEYNKLQKLEIDSDFYRKMTEKFYNKTEVTEDDIGMFYATRGGSKYFAFENMKFRDVPLEARQDFYKKFLKE